MAEFVNRKIEDMLTELEQMKRTNLYTSEEIKEISRKRTDFEYKIHRQTKCKEDYLCYIAYECILLRDIQLRRKEMSMQEKWQDIEFAMSRRVRKLYLELVHRFSDDIQLWLNFIIFCKNVNLEQYIPSIFQSMLQIHGDKPKVWQIASRWEYEENNSITTARNLLIKGLQRHPKNKELYFDAVRLELKGISKLKDENEKEIQLKKANIILNSGLENITDISFLTEMCSIFNEIEETNEIFTELLKKLWENFSDNIEAWEFIAKCELEGKDVEIFDWRSSKEDFFLKKCPPNLANFFSVFEVAISKVQSPVACDRYVTNALKLTASDKYETTIMLQILKRALSKGHMLSQLSEQQYKIWLDLLSCDDSSDIEISQILEEACIKLPTSEFLWEERLKRNKSSTTDFLKIFKQAESSLPPEKGMLLWTILIGNTKDSKHLKKLHEESLRLCPDIVKKLKPIFLEAFYACEGIKVAREMYNYMVMLPPFEMELHKVMIRLEQIQTLPSYKALKNCHEMASHQFGAKNIQVWLNYISFEKEHDHPELCGPLYKRACATLDRNCVDKFIEIYSLNKN